MYDDTYLNSLILFYDFFSAGFEFYESANGVILCPGDENGILPTSLFAKVVQRKKGKNIATAAKRQNFIGRKDAMGSWRRVFVRKIEESHFVNYYLG